MSLQDALSLGWRSALMLARMSGEVLEREDCIVVRTPASPLYYWGNHLLLPTPPRDAELDFWLQRFESELARGRPELAHVAIGFDARQPHEPLLSWARAGFEIYPTLALQLRPGELRAARALAALFRFERIDLSDPSLRARVVQAQCEAIEGGHEPLRYRRYREQQMQLYAAMQAAGRGDWWGIWCEQGGARELVADCGLFDDGRQGRFQHVGTHPAWRRQGLCRALVHAVAQQGLRERGLQALVICADPEGAALCLYESLGFVRDSRFWSAQRRPTWDRVGPSA